MASGNTGFQAGWNVIIGALGFLNAWLVVTVMEYTGLSRYVGHLPFSS
jgi:hypothetical protein